MEFDSEKIFRLQNTESLENSLISSTRRVAGTAIHPQILLTRLFFVSRIIRARWSRDVRPRSVARRRLESLPAGKCACAPPLTLRRWSKGRSQPRKRMMQPNLSRHRSKVGGNGLRSPRKEVIAPCHTDSFSNCEVAGFMNTYRRVSIFRAFRVFRSSLLLDKPLPTKSSPPSFALG